MIDYERIEKAIIFLKENFKNQPDLDEVAKHVHLSPFHFQRLFTDWAGVSPKKFMQFLNVEYAKGLIQKNMSLSKTTYATGLSSTSRLHDLFISIEGMTPGEYKIGGEGLTIHYSFSETIFGNVIVASTNKGICHLTFNDDEDIALQNLNSTFQNARIIQKTDIIQENALQFFTNDWSDLKKIKLHLKGTAFQLKVWNSLLQIPLGSVSYYGQIASNVENPNASRAVGTAIGSNPVAFLIPCHRVIKSSGIIGNYHWGENRKSAMIGWEAAKLVSGM